MKMKIELFEAKFPETSMEMTILAQVFMAFKNKDGLEMARYNLTENPEKFKFYPQVCQLIKKSDTLPLTLVDGEITLIGAYPTLEDLTEITGLSFQNIGR